MGTTSKKEALELLRQTAPTFDKDRLKAYISYYWDFGKDDDTNVKYFKDLFGL